MKINNAEPVYRKSTYRMKNSQCNYRNKYSEGKKECSIGVNAKKLEKTDLFF